MSTSGAFNSSLSQFYENHGLHSYRSDQMKIPNPIQTDRLCIRPFIEPDRAPFLEFMVDPLATRYLVFSPDQKTPEGAAALLDAIIASYGTTDPILSLSIIEGVEKVWLGSCGASPLPGEGVYECYYSLHPRYWHHGYATEAMRGLLKYLFSQADVYMVRAYMDPDNHASQKVAERLGMKPLGMQLHPLFDQQGLTYSLDCPNNSS